MFVLGSKKVGVSMMSWRREARSGGEPTIVNITEVLGLRLKQWEIRLRDSQSPGHKWVRTCSVAFLQRVEGTGRVVAWRSVKRTK